MTIAPLPPGYGLTLGNALRRVLLSSLPGAAPVSVRIKGVQHEYTAMKGILESVVDLCLNIKTLRLRQYSKDPETLKISVKGPKVVTAGDLEHSSGLEILDPTQHICTIEKGGELDMEINVEKGVGYVPATERNRKQSEPGLMYIDSVFGPVEKVQYSVEAARVGQRTNLDKLTLEVKTNGALSGEEAVQFAGQLLKSYFSYFVSEDKVVENEFMADFSRAPVRGAEEHDIAAGGAKESYTPIEILNFSPRTLNALINAGVGSIEQLTRCTESQLSNFRGFGQKALEEVKVTLGERGLALSDDVLEE